MPWSLKHIPDLSGKTAIVTGANAGIGYETARALAGKGARVILACRSAERGQAAVARIQQEHPQASLEFRALDLASLESVRHFAAEFQAENTQLDWLINNAGVMIPPFSQTPEGFELQIGVNFLAPFLLSGLLLPLLNATAGARIITLSSIAHRRGQIDLDSFRSPKPYKAWRAYAQSKLACLIFALELDRRLKQQQHPVLSLAAHPGWTRTELQRHIGLGAYMNQLAMPGPQGALPTLYAALEPCQGGEYIGPDGLFEIWGYPHSARIAPQAHDRTTATALWQAAETLTGLPWP